MENIKDNFIPYEEAKQLHELGWNDFHFAMYYEHDDGPEFLDHIFLDGIDPQKIINAPLWQQTFDFFREKYNLHVNLRFTGKWFIYTKKGYTSIWKSYDFHFNSFEEAQLSSLRELIKLVKK